MTHNKGLSNISDLPQYHIYYGLTTALNTNYLLNNVYYYYIPSNKTENRDFRPAIIRKPFDAWISNFFCFLMVLPNYLKFFLSDSGIGNMGIEIPEYRDFGQNPDFVCYY